MPLLPVFLTDEKGFTERQVSFAFSLSALGMVITPPLMTLLADLKFESRRIIACTLSAAAAMLCGLYFSNGIAITLLFYVLYSIAYMPTFPLLDGLFFSNKRRRELAGEGTSIYGRVRVWGTIGYIIPSLGLFFVLRSADLGGSLMFCAIGFCAASIIASFFLPKSAPKTPTAKRALPSMEAVKSLFSPQARWFTIGLSCTLLAVPVYYMYFPIYLNKTIGIEKGWIPLIINVGVFFEIFYIWKLESIRRLLRLKGIMIAGFCAMALRLLLISLFPCLFTAIATQILHGLEILATVVVPVMFLDRLASDHFRNSIQGVYAMTVLASCRILGALIAGQIAATGIVHAFWWAASLSLTGAAILTFKFHPAPSREAEF